MIAQTGQVVFTSCAPHSFCRFIQQNLVIRSLRTDRVSLPLMVAYIVHLLTIQIQSTLTA